MHRGSGLIEKLWVLAIGLSCAIADPGNTASAQAPAPGPVQPWGLPPLPAGVGPVEKFADVSGTPQGQFLEGGSFDTQSNLWFVAIGSGWVSYYPGPGGPDHSIRWLRGRNWLLPRHRLVSAQNRE